MKKEVIKEESRGRSKLTQVKKEDNKILITDKTNPAKSASPTYSNRNQEADKLDIKIEELTRVQDKGQHDTDKKKRKSSADSFRKRKEKNKVSAQ